MEGVGMLGKLYAFGRVEKYEPAELEQNLDLRFRLILKSNN
jgi:hypothetical protein